MPRVPLIHQILDFIIQTNTNRPASPGSIPEGPLVPTTGVPPGTHLMVAPQSNNTPRRAPSSSEDGVTNDGLVALFFFVRGGCDTCWSSVIKLLLFTETVRRRGLFSHQGIQTTVTPAPQQTAFQDTVLLFI